MGIHPTSHFFSVFAFRFSMKYNSIKQRQLVLFSRMCFDTLFVLFLLTRSLPTYGDGSSGPLRRATRPGAPVCTPRRTSQVAEPPIRRHTRLAPRRCVCTEVCCTQQALPEDPPRAPPQPPHLLPRPHAQLPPPGLPPNKPTNPANDIPLAIP
jgi:hypothetical protein